jgi:hypothetical protein
VYEPEIGDVDEGVVLSELLAIEPGKIPPGEAAHKAGEDAGNCR